MKTSAASVLGDRALGRALLARQFLLERVSLSTAEALSRLIGLQAQNVRPPYGALAARLDGFGPAELSGAMERREAVRLVTMRSILHTHTAADALALAPFTLPVRHRELAHFRKGLVGVDLDRLTAVSRALMLEEPRTPARLRDALAPLWPEADPRALSVAARCLQHLVQVTPRGLWGRSGGVALTPLDHWLGGQVPEGGAAARDVVRRYLGAFGPASVRDAQRWSGLTGLRPVFEQLRPELLVFRSEKGTELFDLPDAPRPDPDTPAPPRLLPEFDNVLLSHADRARIVPAAHKGRTWKGNRAFPVLLVDGRVAGVWEPRDATVTVRAFAPLDRRAREATAAEASRLHAVLAPAAEDGAAFDVRFEPAPG
ncbi:winged helix DNA-binding domain-containing protein [Streptomyces sp. NPDC007088]|uniref:winged helix DNA-binding domain-containing protein n=1 Tax=Streptomyces sp. NPDC007088 TaxID=3364773 RepID=UPI00367AAA74